MSFSLVAIVIVMIFTKAPVYWTILLFPVPLFFLLLFAMGIGMVLSALSVYFRDITHLYGVVTLAWMYLTPIFYPVSALPKEIIPIVQGNPMCSYITFFREIVLYGTVPEPIMWLRCSLISLAALAVGLAVFRKMQRNFILYI